MNLTDLTLNDLERIDKKACVVLIPLNSLEQHGPHLPLGTKSFISEYVAFDAAKMLESENILALVAPAIPFIPCHASFGFPGYFSMSARTYSDALFEVGSSFKNEGFSHIYFVNFSVSLDALKAVSTAVKDLNKLADFHAFDPIPLWAFSPNENIEKLLAELNIKPANELHADIKDTSAIMELLPDLVDRTILNHLPQFVANLTWENLKGNFSFQEMGSELGYVGTPALADKIIGKRYLQEAAIGLHESVKFTKAGNQLPPLPIHIRTLLKLIDLDEM